MIFYDIVIGTVVYEKYEKYIEKFFDRYLFVKYATFREQLRRAKTLWRAAAHLKGAFGSESHKILAGV